MLKSLKANRINVDNRGKITTGIKTKNASGVEYPKATEYFVIDSFPELVEVYGDKPKKLVIVFPTNDPIDFFDVNMVLYGKNNAMIRKCDGVECVHRIDEELDLQAKFVDEETIEQIDVHKRKYAAGEISECCCKLMPQTIAGSGDKEKKNPKLCNCAMYLKAFIVDYKIQRIIKPLCYLFYSGSENTAANIYSELEKVKTITAGRLAGLPFGIRVDMVAGRTNAKVKYPIWNLEILGTMAQLEKSAESFLFDYKEILKIGEGDKSKGDKSKGDKSKQITEGKPKTQPEQRAEIDKDFEFWAELIEKCMTEKELDDLEKDNQFEIRKLDKADFTLIASKLNSHRKFLQDVSKNQ